MVPNLQHRLVSGNFFVADYRSVNTGHTDTQPEDSLDQSEGSHILNPGKGQTDKPFNKKNGNG